MRFWFTFLILICLIVFLRFNQVFDLGENRVSDNQQNNLSNIQKSKIHCSLRHYRAWIAQHEKIDLVKIELFGKSWSELSTLEKCRIQDLFTSSCEKVQPEKYYFEMSIEKFGKTWSELSLEEMCIIRKTDMISEVFFEGKNYYELSEEEQLIVNEEINITINHWEIREIRKKLFEEISLDMDKPQVHKIDEIDLAHELYNNGDYPGSQRFKNSLLFGVPSKKDEARVYDYNNCINEKFYRSKDPHDFCSWYAGIEKNN